MGQLTGEVGWLVNTFWKGLDAIAKVPCRRPCPSPGAGLFDVEDLHLTKAADISKVLCPTCKLWQAIDSLLLGVVPRESDSPLLADQLQEPGQRSLNGSA